MEPLSTLSSQPGEKYASPDSNKVYSITFVLGGPGSGKGTQCGLLAKRHDFIHLSLGDVLREEIKRPGSLYGRTIEKNMREGRVGPMEITVKLLSEAITRATTAKPTKYLIDGFPRKLDQALLFERTICSPESVIVLQCSADILQQRLQGRAALERFDDDPVTIRKRIDTFYNVTKEVLEYYTGQEKVINVAATGSREEVLGRLEAVLGLSENLQ